MLTNDVVSLNNRGPELQIGWGNKDNYGIINHIVLKSIHCDSSLEPSHPDRSNEESQHDFIEK